jgi:uncharacterized protein
MELVNEFDVNASIDHAWDVLTDLERIAPCLPGAQLTEVEGDVYRGFVKIKVGPITAQFKGQAQFVEKDRENYRGTIKADGKDTTGKGNAGAMITAQLSVVTPEVTKCVITTDLTITGKVAQFGRGALADVSGKLIKQFTVNLEETVLKGEGAAAPIAAAETPVAEVAPPATDSATDTSAAPPAAPTVRKIVPTKPVEAVDLLETAGAPMLKRLAPLAVVALLIALFLRRRRG